MAGFDKQQAKSGKAVSSIHTGLDLSMNKQWIHLGRPC
jgi:hypothetical protein